MDFGKIAEMISEVTIELPDGGLLDVVDLITPSLNGCSVLPLNLRLVATIQNAAELDPTCRLGISP